MIAGSRDIRAHLFGAAALLLLAHQAAAAAASGGCDARGLARHEAVRVAELDNWEPVDDRTLLIWTSGSLRAELVKLDQPLEGLAAAPILVLIDSDHDRVISPCGHDSVAVGIEAGQQARIASMELLSEKRTTELDRDATAMPADLRRIREQSKSDAERGAPTSVQMTGSLPLPQRVRT